MTQSHPGERRLEGLRRDGPLTIVYTDVGDSTRMNQTMGDAAAHELMRAHFEIVRGSVARHGGAELDLMGDGFKLAFDDVTRAVRCSLDVQRKLADFTSRHPESPLSVRIGIHLGAVIREDHDVFGETPILASRIMSRARPGEILISEDARSALKTWSAAPIVDRGAYQLKGIRARQRMYEVLWKAEKSFQSERQGRPRANRAARTPFVGREQELLQLENELDETECAYGRVVLVHGAAGIGKTRLVREFIQLIGNRRVLTAVGRCHSQLAEPYQPFVGCLRQLFEQSDPPEASFATDLTPLARLAPDLESQLPDSGVRLADPEPQEDQVRLLNAFASLFLGWASQTPLVLVIDDLQWADTHSLELLRFLGRRLSPFLGGGAPILILATCRDPETAESARVSEALRELDRDELVVRLPIVGFTESEVGVLLRELGGEAIVGQTPAVFRRSQGNPYFVEEIVRDAAERESLDPDATDGREPLHSDVAHVPSGVKAILGGRLSRLGARTLRVLRIGSLVGSQFSFDLIRRASNMSREEVIAAIEEALAARIIRETSSADDPRYTFEHGLVAEVLSEQISTPRAQLQHLAIADALEELHLRGQETSAGRLAHHLVHAGKSAPPERVARYCRLAGKSATSACAFEDAVHFFRAALAALDRCGVSGAVERAELNGNLSVALGRTGRVDEALDLARRAIREFSRLRRADLANQTRASIASTLILHARHRDALPFLSAVVRSHVGSIDAFTAHVLGQYALALDLTGRSDEMRSTAEQLLEVANRLRRPEFRFRALHLLRTWQANHTDDFKKTLSLSRRLHSIATKRGDAWDRASSCADIGFFEFVRGRVGKALESLDEAVDLALRSGTFATIIDVRAVRALCFCYQGEWERVDEEWSHAAPLLGRVPGALRIGLLFWSRAMLDLWLGRPAAPMKPLKYAGSQQLENNVLAGMGLLASERRDPEAASILEMAQRRQPLDGAGVNWLLASQAIAAGWANLGQREKAADWYELLLPYRETLLVSSTDLVLGRIAALEERWEASSQDFNRAIRLFRRERLLPHLGIALYERGRGELAGPSSHTATARKRLIEAQGVFESLGMELYQEQVESLLQTAGS